MTSEIKLPGLATNVASQALTSAHVYSGRGNAEKAGAPAETTTRNEAGFRQADFARALDSRDAQYEDVLKVRADDRLYAAAGEKLSAIKYSLESVTKRYPPYPKDSPERQSAVDDAIGLRKQIEALLVPAEADSRRVGQAQADAERKQFLRDLMGLQEWPVDNISDEELARLLGQVDQTLEAVAGARKAMWADIVDQVSAEEVQAAAKLGKDSGEALATERHSIGQDKQALSALV